MSETLTAFRSFREQSRTSRALAKRRTEDRLLDAARRLFAERGYDGVTVRDIAATAGVSTGAIFANFSGKGEIFNRVIETCYNELYEFMSAVDISDLNARDKVVVLMNIAYDYQSKQLGLSQAVTGYHWRSEGAAEIRARLSINRILSIFRKTLQNGVESGELSERLNVDLAVGMLWDFCICSFRRIMVDDLEIYMSRDQLVDRVDFLLENYLI